MKIFRASIASIVFLLAAGETVGLKRGFHSIGRPAAQQMRIEFSASMDGVAATGGTKVFCSGN